MKYHLNRRQFLRIAGAGTVAALLSGCGPLKKKKRPNVLFVAVDDLRPELGCYGRDHVISPNIDRLAGDGIVFERAYCQSAVCNPSRASLLTGKRPDSIRVWDLQTRLRDNVPDVVTLPQYFRQNGYHTAGIGKIYHNTIPDPPSWSEPKLYIDGYPFDPDAVYRSRETVTSLEAKKKRITAAGRRERYIDRFGQWYLKDVVTEAPDVPDNAYFDGAQTDVALEKLKEFKEMDKPFFFAVGFYRPHLPFNAPRKYWDLYDRGRIPLAENDFLPKNMPPMAINNMREILGYADMRGKPNSFRGKLSEEDARLLKHGYLACVSYIDAQVGRLLDALERLGLRDNTVVILWGDHGWKLGEHNSWAKMTNFEVDARVPMIISTPDLHGESKRCGRLTEFVDIYPTLCDLAGLPVPDDLEGVSLKPLMKDPGRPWKTAVFTQFLREGIWRHEDGRTYMGYSIRTDRYRFTRWIDWETKEETGFELYDHGNDPQENVNLAGMSEYQMTVKEMRQRLDAGWTAALP
jgi:arylsulfatase A-like enzyme